MMTVLSVKYGENEIQEINLSEKKEQIRKINARRKIKRKIVGATLGVISFICLAGWTGTFEIEKMRFITYCILSALSLGGLWMGVSIFNK